MIGVIADSVEHEIVREFFQLFKTPWEFYRKDRQYEVVLCVGDREFDQLAKIVICYAGRETHFDTNVQTTCQQRHTCILSYQQNRIPIYGDTITFTLPQERNAFLADEDSGQCVAYLDRSGNKVLARIGYDLFGEVRTLLTVGQPPDNASFPALELHIAFLRDLITGCGVPLVEVPPVPEGYRFIACLTHDVDHPSIRRHKLDHTALGFLYRAVVGSLRDLIRGRLPLGDLLKNWAAVVKLPFVHLGLAKDFWRQFDDCYLELENGLPSTFFVIPFENCPGKNSHGPAPAFRAARYGAKDIASTIGKLMAAGCEIGLHGIDAWIESAKGVEELEEIRRVTGMSEIGVRMHWLYYDQQSPRNLENAGVTYDSTIGYNQTVGYRAGTTQVYKRTDADRLLELPLHVMDTALFYPAYLGRSRCQARVLLNRMVEDAVQFGGCLTINWHDRSIVPERLWDGCYQDLLQDLKNRGAWFSTAGQVVSWFQKRRSVVFETDGIEAHTVRARFTRDPSGHLPGLRLRVHQRRETSGSADYVDIGIDEHVEPRIPSVVGS